MAAHAFPLTVKLLLEKEGLYIPTDEDRSACLAIDMLLVEKQWVEDGDGDGHEDADENESVVRSWHEVVQKIASNVQFDALGEIQRGNIRRRSKPIMNLGRADRLGWQADVESYPPGSHERRVI